MTEKISTTSLLEVFHTKRYLNFQKSILFGIEKNIAGTQSAAIDRKNNATGNSSSFISFSGVHSELSQKSKINR